MSDFPLVSIITPSYNQADFLEYTILSVLSQDYPRIEYWVMDGGSTDGSIEIIKKYEDRLADWVSEPDKGQADAINKGFSKANGEIIAWLNSDDIYRPNAIKHAVAIFRQSPEVGLVYSDVDSIDADGEVFNRMTYEQWALPDLMMFKILGQASVFFRRQVLGQAGFLDPNFHYMLDHHLWLRMASITKLQYAAGQVWAAARMHGGAKNIAQAEGFGREAIQLAQWMAEDERFSPYYQSNNHRIWAGAHRLNAFYLLNEGKPGAALKAYWSAFWQCPQTVLKDWRRICYALLSPFKPEKYRDRYLARKKDRIIEG